MLDDEASRLWGAVATVDERCSKLLRVVAFMDRPDYQSLEPGPRHACREHRSHPGPVPGQGPNRPDERRRAMTAGDEPLSSRNCVTCG